MNGSSDSLLLPGLRPPQQNAALGPHGSRMRSIVAVAKTSRIRGINSHAICAPSWGNDVRRAGVARVARPILRAAPAQPCPTMGQRTLRCLPLHRGLHRTGFPQLHDSLVIPPHRNLDGWERIKPVARLPTYIQHRELIRQYGVRQPGELSDEAVKGEPR